MESQLPTAVRRAEERDLRTVAAIHRSQFRDHFLGQYSTSLLARYYGTFLGKSVFLVHEGAEGVDGFVLGCEPAEESACRTRFMRSALLRCLFETFSRPRLWWSALRRGLANAKAARSSRGRPADASAKKPVNVLSIAVAQEAMGKGVARALLDAFEQAITDRGLNEYRVSAHKTNPRAIRFYAKMGFEIAKEDAGDLYFRKKLPRRTSP